MYYLPIDSKVYDAMYVHRFDSDKDYFKKI